MNIQYHNGGLHVIKVLRIIATIFTFSHLLEDPTLGLHLGLVNSWGSSKAIDSKQAWHRSAERNFHYF